KKAKFEECIENIDIGGPSMIRSAAKNHDYVAVVVDPKDYGAVIEELKVKKGGLSDETRKKLAGKAFARTAAYDSAISNWFFQKEERDFPDFFSLGGRLKEILRYGENPHQRAALYLSGCSGIASAEQIQGKELSYNNLCDAEAAFSLVNEF